MGKANGWFVQLSFSSTFRRFDATLEQKAKKDTLVPSKQPIGSKFSFVEFKKQSMYRQKYCTTI